MIGGTYSKGQMTFFERVDFWLQWSDENLPVMLQSKRYSEAKTHRELKEKLFYDIIDCLDKGKMWEKGIEMCKELAQQYEQETLDYIRLSEILVRVISLSVLLGNCLVFQQRQAECYDRIMKQVRPDPYYFRVGYYGLGFPSFIQVIGHQNKYPITLFC